MVTERRRVLNQIGSQLFTQGYRDVPESSRGLTAWLAPPREIGPQRRARLERDIERLALLETPLRVIEKHLAEQVQQQQTRRIAGVAKALMQLSGIGLSGAWVLASEIYGWREFRHRREVGAALGLTPTPYSSGADQREQGISKAGNRRARRLWVEWSWLWLRDQPASALSQGFLRRFSGGGKRLRRIGIVALARRLGVALWRYAAQGVVPEGAVLKGAKA